MAANFHVSLAAETIFNIGSFPVTNSMINVVIAFVVTCVLAIVIQFRAKRLVPRGIQNFMELVIEGLLTFFDKITGDREKSRRFFPVVGTLFLFILFSNWLGLLPGTGSIGVWQTMADGHQQFTPLLRPANADLNMTLALAVVAVVSSHVYAVFSLGFFTHLNKFFALISLWKSLKTFNIIKIFTALVEAMVGVLEFISEFAKLASLSLRLFGNIFAGEILIAVISSLVSFVVPVPFMVLELMVGLIQATVFTTLTVVYLTVMSARPHGHDEKHHGLADMSEDPYLINPGLVTGKTAL